MSYAPYGYGRGRGGRGRGMYPGNGPFSHLPPWERPGWIYGPGSCWYLGLRTDAAGTSVPVVDNVEALRHQKELLETQLASISKTLDQINSRLDELEAKNE